MKESFPWRLILLCLGFSVGGAFATDLPTVFDEGKLQVGLPLGWKESEQDTGGSSSVGGWESADRKTSFYVLNAGLQQDPRMALDEFVDNFDRDETWQIEKVGEFRAIELNGLPASYVQVDLVLVAGDRKIPFEFHFAMVGGARSFYVLQGSIMKPVWKPRRDEIIRMMKSFRELDP